DNRKVGLFATRLRRLRLHKVRRLAQMVGLQLLLESLVGGFREHTFFLKNRQDTHGLCREGWWVSGVKSDYGYARTFSISSIQAAKSMPKSMNAHSMPSRLYSSCSSTNMWWLKNCCNFSLVKLMHNCSKPLKSKISKPAISSTPMKYWRFCWVSSVSFS